MRVNFFLKAHIIDKKFKKISLRLPPVISKWFWYYVPLRFLHSLQYNGGEYKFDCGTEKFNIKLKEQYVGYFNTLFLKCQHCFPNNGPNTPLHNKGTQEFVYLFIGNLGKLTLLKDEY